MNRAMLLADGGDEEDSCQSWLQFYRCYFNFTYHLCIVPFRISIDPITKRPLITTEKAQRVICILLQCSSLLYIRTTFTAGWDYVLEGTDPVSYFDLMFLVLLYGFDVTTKFTFWGRLQQFSSLVDELSNEKRLRVRSLWRPVQVRLLVYSICILYLIPSALYIALVLGVDPSDTSGLMDGIKVHTESIFATSLTSSGTFSLVQQVAAVACTLYTSAFWHYCDVFVLVSALFWYRVTSDFFDAVERGDIDDMEVVSHYEKFKVLNEKCNSVAGLAVNIFLTYPLSYYATHLVDMLNNSDLMNRFTMCIYLGNLSISMVLAAKINMRAHDAMASWMRHQGYPHVDAQRLKVILSDVRDCRIGLRGLFTVTMGFVGDIVNLLLTLTVITIQFRLP